MASAPVVAGNRRGLAAVFGEDQRDGEVTFCEAVVAVGELKLIGPRDEPIKEPGDLQAKDLPILFISPNGTMLVQFIDIIVDVPGEIEYNSGSDNN